MIEEWKKVPDYPGYQVSNQGRMMSPDGKLMVGKMSRGYKQIACFISTGKYKTYNLHRLIAELFIPNPNNLPQVDHINEDKLDNRVENLRWVTRSTNIRHSVHSRKRVTSQWKRPIFMFSKEGHRYSFGSEKDAAHELGVNVQGIWCCLHGRQKTTGSMQFEFA